MRKRILLLLTLTIVISAINGCAFPTPNILLPTQEQVVWSEREIELLEGASERIEYCRKGDATVLVVDAAGTPVTDAVVHMDMLKHDFLFGANLFILDLDKLPPIKQAGSPPIEQDYPPAFKQTYSDAFAKLFNYATLPFYCQTL